MIMAMRERMKSRLVKVRCREHGDGISHNQSSIALGTLGLTMLRRRFAFDSWIRTKTVDILFLQQEETRDSLTGFGILKIPRCS